MGELLIRGLSKRYADGRGSSFVALDAVSFTWREEESIAVMGDSGCGKSTLARLLLGLERPSSGEVLLDGVPLSTLGFRRWRKYRKFVQGVFQDASGTLNPAFSAYRNMEEGLRNLTDLGRSQRRQVIYGLMERFGLDMTLLRAPVRALSGGEQRRVSLLRALAVKPRFLVLDEVLSGLDLLTCDKVLETLEDYRAEYGCAYLLITHDEYGALRLTDRRLLLRGGRLIGEARKRMERE